MTATKYDITFAYGASLDRPAFQHMDDSVDPRVPKPLVGYTVRMAIEDSRGNRMLTLSSESGGGITFNGATSLGSLNATSEKMKSGKLVQGRSYSYDLWAISPDDAIKIPLLYGSFIVASSVTEV